MNYSVPLTFLFVKKKNKLVLPCLISKQYCVAQQKVDIQITWPR